MLVLGRNFGQGITLDIGDIHVEVYVLRQNGRQVILGVEADRHAVRVERCEVPRSLIERGPNANPAS